MCYLYTFMKKEKINKLIISIFSVLIIWIVSSYFTSSSIETWYLLLEKPSFNPPNWIFWPIWTTLYIMIWISFYLVWDKWFWKEKKISKTIYFIQLFLNFTWSFTFFYLENPLLWLINIFILWIFIILNIIYFYKINKVSWLLLLPYFLWVSFASILNYNIFILN